MYINIWVYIYTCVYIYIYMLPSSSPRGQVGGAYFMHGGQSISMRAVDIQSTH